MMQLNIYLVDYETLDSKKQDLSKKVLKVLSNWFGQFKNKC